MRGPMPAVAFLTLDDRHAYVIDDDLAVAELRSRQWRVEEVPWRRKGVDWRKFDVVVIRTTWDYQHHVEEFLDVLGAIERAGVLLLNPLDLVTWNLRKTYLRDLEARGVRVVPTRWGMGLPVEAARPLGVAIGSDEWVLKPTVGANALDAHRLPREVDKGTAMYLEGVFRGRGWMAQPFVRSVLDEGERSLFYFDGAYSHAVRKVPRAGDFRVQEEHGGRISRDVPDAEMHKAAERAMRMLGDPPLQARVDLVRLDDGALAVMELEVIEPALYFRTDPAAAGRFADALARHRARVIAGTRTRR